MQQTLAQVADWQDLRRRIQTARTKENSMNDRVKQLWLPGFVTFLLSMSLLALNEIFGPKPFALMKVRSEEHTSELQSRLHLVCRLLLEKKKTNIATTVAVNSPFLIIISPPSY